MDRRQAKGPLLAQAYKEAARMQAMAEGKGPAVPDSQAHLEGKVRQVQLEMRGKTAALEQRLGELERQMRRMEKVADASSQTRYNPYKARDFKAMREINDRNIKRLAKLVGTDSIEPTNIKGMLTDEFDADQSSVDIVKDARHS